MVLVTHEGQGEKPRERGCTDDLLRWRRVWREQELWIVPKEGREVLSFPLQQSGELLSLFTDEMLPYWER